MRQFLFFLALSFIIITSFSAFSQVEDSKLSIMSREKWNAGPPIMEMKKHTPLFITIHHTGTNQNLNRSTKEKLQALQRFSHTEGFLGDGTPKKPWSDVPYHFYIAANGTIAEGREIEYEGDSNTNYDLNGHILIVVEGNFDKEELTDSQVINLEKLVSTLAEKWQIPADYISGHKDQASTTCPGNNLYGFLPQLRENRRSVTPSRVKIGAEQLFSPEYEKLIKGKRVGLVTNHTGLLPDGTHLIDHLNDNRDVDLTVLFGPEHGLRGEEDTHVADGVDKKTGLPIISLYGKVRKPTKEMLDKVDVLIFDIQDIGARYYTYIKTMLNVLEAAAEEGIPFIVLDRPNPITGNYVDGPLGRALEPASGIGNIPITHGMTVGELALMFNGERMEKKLPKANLTIIPLKNYNRRQWYDSTGIPWIKPSPNMLTLNTAIVYPATCLLEGTNYSEARGTLKPFEIFGAPWIDGKKLATKLNSYQLDGVIFTPKTFIPESIVDGIKIYPPKFLGEQCEGVEIVVTDRENFQSAKTGVYILYALNKLYPNKFEWRNERMDGLLGTSEVRKQLQEGIFPQEIVQKWNKEINDFKQKRKKYLLYN